jgi:hypothetical protein
MKALLFAALASVITATATGQSQAASSSSKGTSERTSEDRVSIHVYNLSGIPSVTLDRAFREVSRIFAQADTDVRWELGDPEAEEAHATDQSGPASFRDKHVRSYLVVRIGRGLARNVPSASLGMSLPYAQYGVSATVFEERVESLCQTAGQDFAIILGHAIAHELGHVVLASHGHAPAGIMRARWGRADFDQAATGQLGFTAHQGVEIRDYVARKSSQLKELYGSDQRSKE